MRIAYNPNPDKGVTHLMYVGDDGLDGILGTTPWAERAPKIALAVGALALVYYLATRKPRRSP
jgi:hypothetical protein